MGPTPLCTPLEVAEVPPPPPPPCREDARAPPRPPPPADARAWVWCSSVSMRYVLWARFT